MLISVNSAATGFTALLPYEPEQMMRAPDLPGDMTEKDVIHAHADHRETDSLRIKAARCRRLAQAMTDQQAIDTLLAMASEFDADAWGRSNGARR